MLVHGQWIRIDGISEMSPGVCRDIFRELNRSYGYVNCVEFGEPKALLQAVLNRLKVERDVNFHFGSLSSVFHQICYYLSLKLPWFILLRAKRGNVRMGIVGRAGASR